MNNMMVSITGRPEGRLALLVTGVLTLGSDLALERRIGEVFFTSCNAVTLPGSLERHATFTVYPDQLAHIGAKLKAIIADIDHFELAA